MKEQYFENCEKERNQLLSVLNMLWNRMAIYDGKPIELFKQNPTQNVTE